MFETFDDAEVTQPKLFGENDSRQWAYVYRRLHNTWFHVVCQPVDPELHYAPRIFFMPNVNDLVALAGDPSAQIVEASVVTPERLNGSGAWQMDGLKQVLVGWQEVKGNALRVLIYTLQDGRRLIDASPEVRDSHIRDPEILWPLATETH
ncbi:MAG: hypothetical protein KZQ86_01830 [Candidatus Thiodiazotropha sp. (ex Lucinoma kastoroae)]|nr:hypothetical protein [Candidatus Thiodiazotropha sp. (ex Lucinoma kastoroae)]